MNIFVTSKCPTKAAKFLDDKRVVKMVLESAQMLSTAITEHGGKAPYKPTHKNHPCNVWARKTRANYLWLLNHFIALANEYTSRYQKIHKSFNLLPQLLHGAEHIPNGKLTPFANCAAHAELGLSYKHIKDIEKAYQLYLNDRWDTDKRIPTWYGENR
ncbi:MAG: hypothetical protein GY920_20255 [Aliivibrio sp.]|nr:hypothetical protein [Aliivibrio sp.]MCP4322130.1 hypothetical protein [Alteromonadales bacterium]